MIALRGVRIETGAFRLSADWMLDRGAIAAVIGPSGAGKSTLLNAVAGFVPISQGRLELQGQDMRNSAPSQRPVAMLFQDSNLFPHLSVTQNVGLGLRPTLKLTEPERGKVAAALKDTGIVDLGARRPAELSGGQQSRAALARALLQERPVLLLDEPFAALGPALRIEMLDLVARVARARDLTVMMVTHDPADAKRIAEMTILVDAGQAAPPVETETLFQNPPAALRAYLG